MNLYWFIKREVKLQHFINYGNNVFINSVCIFSKSCVSIGSNVYIGQNCQLQSTQGIILKTSLCLVQMFQYLGKTTAEILLKNTRKV